VLLAKNRIGYRNLIRLSSIGFLEGYHRRPRIDKEVLAEHREGIVCLAACLSGEVSLWLRQGNFEEARRSAEWFAQNFKYRTMEEFNRGCPPGSSMNAYARMVMSYWEMVASFVANGVLNQELFFQSGMEMLFVWVRVRELIPQMREANKNPISYQNLEKVSTTFIKWLEDHAPEAFTAFAARIG